MNQDASDSFRNVTRYTGQDYSFAPRYVRTRDPTIHDIKPKENQGFYPTGSLWITSNNLNIWLLQKIFYNPADTPAQVNARWILLGNAANGPLDGIIVPHGTTPIVPDVSGFITFTSNDSSVVITGSTGGNPNFIDFSVTAGTGTVKGTVGDDSSNVNPNGSGYVPLVGTVVANAAHAKPVFFNKVGSNEELDVQLATTASSAPANSNSAGLALFDSNQFNIDTTSGWVSIKGSSTNPPVLGVHPDAHTAPGTDPVTADSSGNITIEGGTTYATATRAFPIRVNSLTANKMDLEIQLAGSNASVSTANNFGVAQFDANQFTVSSGFVRLIGGVTPAVLNVVLDTGTSPITPNGSGAITLTGGAVANNGHPLRTDGTGASTAKIEVQYSKSNATTDATLAGVASFSSAQFTVDANGFVSLAGLGTGAIESITTDDPFAVLPSVGTVNLTGNTVAFGSHAKPIFTHHPSANNMTIDVQLATTSTSGAKNINNAGIASFDSSTFTVDAATGFVTLSSSGTLTSVPTDSGTAAPAAGVLNILGDGTATTTGSGNTVTVYAPKWSVVTANTNMVKANGYFTNNAGQLQMTLPSIASVGDTVHIAGMGAGGWIIKQGAGQSCHFGKSNTTVGAGGSLAATFQYDCVTLVCNIANTDWVVVHSVGNLTVV